MRRAVLCAVLVMLGVSSAFAGVTEDLLNAAMSGNTTPRMIQNLIKFGADVNAKDKKGWTALMLATLINTNPAVIRTLLKAGTDVNAKLNYDGTALMLAAEYNSNTEVTRILINAGADIFAKDNRTRLRTD